MYPNGLTLIKHSAWQNQLLGKQLCLLFQILEHHHHQSLLYYLVLSNHHHHRRHLHCQQFPRQQFLLIDRLLVSFRLHFLHQNFRLYKSQEVFLLVVLTFLLRLNIYFVDPLILRNLISHLVQQQF